VSRAREPELDEESEASDATEVPDPPDPPDEEPAAQVPEAQAAPEPAVPPIQRRRPRPGAPATEQKAPWRAPWRSIEAVGLWSEICARMRQYPDKLGAPHDLLIQIWSQDENPRILITVNGGQVVGYEGLSPGEAMRNFIIDRVHYPMARGPSTYGIAFVWARNNQFYARSRMNLGSVEEILQLRRAAQAASATVHGYPPPAPAPGAHPYMPPPAYAPPPAYGPPVGYGAPPVPAPAAGPAHDREMALIAELAASRGMTNDMMQRALEYARATAQPPPVGTGSIQDVVRSEIARLVPDLSAEIARSVSARLGLPQPPAQPQPGVAAPPAAAATARVSNDPFDKLRGVAESSFTAILEGTLRNVFKAVNENMARGFGAPPVEVVAEPAEPEAKPDPDEHLPFHKVGLGVTWHDGREVTYARSKTDGNIDPMGVLMSNPIIGETFLDIATGLKDAASAFATRVATGQAPAAAPPQVVRTIPRGAKFAGVGYPAGAPAPPPAAQAPRAAPTPAPAQGAAPPPPPPPQEPAPPKSWPG
jgi:hypothetical protein